MRRDVSKGLAACEWCCFGLFKPGEEFAVRGTQTLSLPAGNQKGQVKRSAVSVGRDSDLGAHGFWFLDLGTGLWVCGVLRRIITGCSAGAASCFLGSGAELVSGHPQGGWPNWATRPAAGSCSPGGIRRTLSGSTLRRRRESWGVVPYSSRIRTK